MIGPLKQENEAWEEHEDYLLGWTTYGAYPWEYGIFDNPNGPYLRSRFIGDGRPIHPGVDPQTSEILRLRAEVEALADSLEAYVALEENGEDSPNSGKPVRENAIAALRKAGRLVESMTVGATPCGTPVVYVSDPAGQAVATYSLPVMALCEEALWLAKEKVRARAAAGVEVEEVPYLDRRLLEDDAP